ncbi:hypothetical protein R3P38DRAFT_2935454 [Favolaschia claudopus]|uniref:Secreted protein n=1 Tax=Favolaschia claudopus TaxID=2862362 RepID=A0AAW0BP31_9AGAR
MAIARPLYLLSLTLEWVICKTCLSQTTPRRDFPKATQSSEVPFATSPNKNLFNNATKRIQSILLKFKRNSRTTKRTH